MKHWFSRGIDLDSAAAIENDETMIINSDHSIITTPVESPQDIAGTSKKSPERKMSLLQVESDETLTSDTSSSGAVVGEKNKRHRPKARSESNRSEKYAKMLFFCSLFCFLSCSIGCSFQFCPFSLTIEPYWSTWQHPPVNCVFKIELVVFYCSIFTPTLISLPTLYLCDCKYLISIGNIACVMINSDKRTIRMLHRFRNLINFVKTHFSPFGFQFVSVFHVNLFHYFQSILNKKMSKLNSRSAPVILKKEDKGETRSTSKTVMFEGINDDKFLSIFTKSSVNGPNQGLAKGPRDELLLWVSNK